MFSIWMKGMGDFLNLTPGVGTARLTSLGVLARHCSDEAHREMRVPAKDGSVLEGIQQVSGSKAVPQNVFYPGAGFVGSVWGVPAHAQLLHVLVQRRYRRHGGGG